MLVDIRVWTCPWLHKSKPVERSIDSMPNSWHRSRIRPLLRIFTWGLWARLALRSSARIPVRAGSRSWVWFSKSKTITEIGPMSSRSKRRYVKAKATIEVSNTAVSISIVFRRGLRRGSRLASSIGDCMPKPKCHQICFISSIISCTEAYLSSTCFCRALFMIRSSSVGVEGLICVGGMGSSFTIE